MKRKIIFCTLFLIGCTYGERRDWDSGGQAQRAQTQQRMEETSERVNNVIPPAGKSSTEAHQPF